MDLNRGNNVLYWRTTAFSVWSKVSKPVLVRNIAITGTESWAVPALCKAVPAPDLGGRVSVDPQELTAGSFMLFFLHRGGLHIRVLPLQARHLRRQAGLLVLQALPSQLVLQ